MTEWRLGAQTIPLCIRAGLRGLTDVLTGRAVCCASKAGESAHIKKERVSKDKQERGLRVINRVQ